MRLKATEQDGIKSAIFSIYKKFKYKLFLYGSRVNDAARGGDIDLLLLCEDSDLDALMSLKGKALVEIEKNIGERRVDLTIATNASTRQSEFVRSIIERAIMIDIVG